LEACEGGHAVAEELVVGFLLLVGGVEGPLSHGEGEVGSALEDGQGGGFFGGFLGDLHAGGAGADDGDTFAFDVDAFVGPEGGVVHHAFEGVDAFPVWEVALGGEAGGDDEEAASCRAAVFGLDGPFAG